MFRKSSMCGIGACVEVNTEYKTSSACLAGACVEVNTKPEAGIGGFSSDTEIREGDVAIRNSKNPDVAILFSSDEWGIFIIGVKNGEFDV